MMRRNSAANFGAHLMGIISVTSFVSLDGVMQSPGAPTEDPSGGFTHGGWFIPFVDDAFGSFIVGILQRPAALLLGRKTYDIFAAHWPLVTNPNDPIAAALNARHKYVVTHRPGLEWGPATALGSDLRAEVAKLKSSIDGEIQVHGSAQLASALLEARLVDRLNLVVAPVMLGSGKRLFGPKGSSAWALTGSQRTGNGLVLSTYEPAGEVKHASAPPP
jgi:dihydrofolate reductase